MLICAPGIAFVAFQDIAKLVNGLFLPCWIGEAPLTRESKEAILVFVAIFLGSMLIGIAYGVLSAVTFKLLALNEAQHKQARACHPCPPPPSQSAAQRKHI